MGKMFQMFQHVDRVRAGGYHNAWGHKYKSDRIREPVYAKRQPLEDELVNVIGMLVEMWNGQVEEARWQSTYDTENMVIFHGLELIQSYVEHFTSYCAKTVYRNLQEDGSESCNQSLNECFM